MWHFYLETPEFPPSDECKLDCKSRPCAKCHKCRDWHFSGDQESWNWVCNYENWTDQDWNLWNRGRYQLFTERDGATCYDASDDYYNTSTEA